MRTTVSLLLLTSLACARHSAADQYSQSTPSEAVVTFRTSTSVAFVSLTNVAPIDWSNAAWLRNRAVGPGGQYMAYSLSSEAPVLFLAERKPADPRFRISTVPVNTGRAAVPSEPQPTSEASPLPEWCEEQTWIAGFFIEGIGPRPTHPVVLEYRAGPDTYRLRVDPDRSTITGDAALSIADEELSGLDRAADSRSISVEVASRAPPVFPLLIEWRTVRVNASGFSFGRRMQLSTSGLSSDPVTRWSVYFLEALPAMERAGVNADLESCDGS